jgi:hypothetical protein
MKIETANFILSVIIQFLGITFMRYVFFPDDMWEPFIVVFRVVISLLFVYLFGAFNIIKKQIL